MCDQWPVTGEWLGLLPCQPARTAESGAMFLLKGVPAQAPFRALRRRSRESPDVTKLPMCP